MGSRILWFRTCPFLFGLEGGGGGRFSNVESNCKANGTWHETTRGL